MGANFNVAGPASISVGLGASGAAVWLGRTQGDAEFRETLFERNVQADASGEAAADVALVGKECFLTVRMAYFDPTVMNLVRARTTGGTLGGIAAGDIGGLVLTNKLSFPVWCVAPYQAIRSAFTSNEPGVQLLWAYCAREVPVNMGTKEQVISLTFRGLTNLDMGALTGTCWNQVITGAAAPPTSSPVHA